MSLRTIESIVEQGKVVKNGGGKYQRKQNFFSKIDDYFEKLKPTNNLWFLPK